MCDNETDSFGPSTSSQRNEVEIRRGKQLLQDLLKPFSFNWQRECLMREGRVSKVYYRSPPIMKDNRRRRRFRDKVKLKKYLSLTKSELSANHFFFRRNFLGLRNLDLKREAKSKTSFTDQTSALSHFWIENEDQLGAKLNRRGKCRLCQDHDINSGEITYKQFLKHMTSVHLPEETCEICGQEIQAVEYNRHWEFCDGDINDKEVKGNREVVLGEAVANETFDIKEDLHKYCVEIPSLSRNVSDKQTRKVRCILCYQIISFHNFPRHLKRFHFEPESCVKCKFMVRSGELKNHQLECPGEMSFSKISVGSFIEYQGRPEIKLPRRPTEQFCPPMESNKLLAQEDIVGSNTDYKIFDTS